MFTPQQIEQISFGKQAFGGYDMEAVDQFLEPLTEDYITLYKENALLKNKMRVLVGKLEEYRQTEASMKDAIVNSQKACDKMIKEAEAKCTQMLNDANATAIENAKNSDALIAEETARVEEAKVAAAAKILKIEEQLKACLQSLAQIRESNRPSPVKSTTADGPKMYDFDQDVGAPAVDPTKAMADEISSNLEAMMGTTEDSAPKAEPRHPINDTTSRKFDNLQFGRNYPHT